MRDIDIENTAFEPPPPPNRPRMTDEQADEEENAELDEAFQETREAWERELKRAG